MSELPTVRLWLLLTRVVAAGRAEGRTFRQVWQTAILNLGGVDDPVRLLQSVGDALLLVRAAREEIARILTEPDEELHREPLDRVENALKNANLERPWSQFREHLGDSPIQLKYCADVVRRVTGNVPEAVSTGDLASFRSDVNTLFLEIGSSALPEPLKAFLMARLRDMTRAIDEHWINGLDPLDASLEQTLGGVARRYEAVKEAAGDSTNNELLVKFWVVLKRAGEIVSLAKHVKELADPYIAAAMEKLLQLPPGPSSLNL